MGRKIRNGGIHEASMSSYDLSVITIVKNDMTGLERTRKSVAIQQDCDIQHIVVDGNSTDGTSGLVLEWKLRGDIETPLGEDTGIYSAMNMGLDQASAPFIWFLNAGDSFATSNVAARAIKAIGSYDWAYGAVVPVNDNGDRVGATLQSEVTLRGLRWGQRYFNHQALIMRRDFLREIGGFDETYECAGEFEMYLRAVEFNLPLRVREEWTLYQVGGFSMSNGRLHLIETYRARQQNIVSSPLAKMYNVNITSYRIVRNWIGNRKIPWLYKARKWYLTKRFALRK